MLGMAKKQVLTESCVVEHLDSSSEPEMFKEIHNGVTL